MCNAVAIPGPPDDRDPAGRGNLPDAGQERQWITEQVVTLARRYDASELETVHAFLAQCVRALRHDTLVWLETRSAHHHDDH